MKTILLLAANLSFLQMFSQDTVIVRNGDTTLTKALDEVIVSASRMKEKLLQSPVSIEKEGNEYFTRSSAPSFFDALQGLKGVQMITPSLGFRVINTRGFANTTNVRFSQLVDGMDVQSPHIGEPVGNALGPTDLDIKSVEIIPGSASALYGMNTTNGMANFFTKSPFESEGLSVQQKTGINHINSTASGLKLFSETALRFSKIISPRLAFKINGSFSKGYDWVADDHTDLNASANSSTSLTGEVNPGADPVNGYGNESSNRRTLSLQGKNYVVARTGYYEKEVTDYSLQNTKVDAGLYYKPTKKSSIAYTYRRADFNTVYQRSNRFRLQGYTVQQHGLDYTAPSIKAKAYINLENTGKSYNLRSIAENMDRLAKTDDQWFGTYSATFSDAVSQGQSVAAAHTTARTFADDGRLQPGTIAFGKGIQKLQDINNWDSGAALRVKAALLHAEAQVDLTQRYLAQLKEKTGLMLLTGMDARSYAIVPDGNYFINPHTGKQNQNLVYSRQGIFASVNRYFFGSKLKTGLVLRLDKNDYFNAKTIFRATAVYFPSSAHTIRAAFQNGYRFPSIFEGFSNINSGVVKRVGGLRVMSNGIFETSWLKSSIDAFVTAVNKDVNLSGISQSMAIEKNKALLKKNEYTYLKPEYIRTLEAGYRGLILEKRLLIDVDFYYSKYRSFIAQVEVSTPRTQHADSIPYALYEKKMQARYRLWTNSKSVIYNYGSALKARWTLNKGYLIDCNASFTKLIKNDNGDGLEDGFNTPQWMMNIGISNDKIFKKIGAGVLFRWQDSYYWQSFLVNGVVPAIAAVDAQVSYAFLRMPLRLKIGATNLSNHYQASFLGGPQVGGFYYTMLTYGLN